MRWIRVAASSLLANPLRIEESTGRCRAAVMSQNSETVGVKGDEAG